MRRRTFPAAVTAAVLLLTAPVPAQIDLAALGRSMPRADGAARAAGLAHPVLVTRDERSIPVVSARTHEDAQCALGFLHAQERFFQMDMMRRLAAGRLAEVAGTALVGMDRHYRRYRFTDVADRTVALLRPDERRILEAYAAGVNAGLADLAAAPPEYAVIGASPEPWAPRDSILCVLAMFDMLSFDASAERIAAVAAEALSPALVAFLEPQRTRFDAPLLGPDPDEEPPITMPGPEVVDLRGRKPVDSGDVIGQPLDPAGSNNFAVAGSRTVHGGAIVANDPHLQLTAPGVWYRAELRWGGGADAPDGADRGARAVGVTMPGAPGVIIGASDHLAWGMTNLMGDFEDLVLVEVDPADPSRYLTPEGSEPFTSIVEEIRVNGAAPVRLALRSTRWGVVFDEDWRGRPRVLDWTALHPEMIDLAILRLPEARTLEAGVAVAGAWRGPPQNVLLGDRGGRIAWVVSGYLPRRVGGDGTVPASRARDGIGWDGALDESLRPRLIDPPGGILYTANNRTVDEAWAARLGRTWDLGARARRIRDRLLEAEKVDERALLAIQLDTRVELLDFYRDLLLETTEKSARSSDSIVRRAVQQWSGTADRDQTAMPLLDGFRDELHERILAPLTAPCRVLDPGLRFRSFRAEEAVRRILEERPNHLLPPGAASWRDLLRSALDAVLVRIAGPLAGLDPPAWGDIVRVHVDHPLGSEVPPMLAGMLNMPTAPANGYLYAVRVQTPSFGASMRMVASPGRLESAIMHAPAGQSGHPLSPHYRDGHAAWRDGLPTPMLAGEAAATLTLEP
jgi:penicillin amidase